MPHDSKRDKTGERVKSAVIHRALALAFPICSDDKISSASCARVSCVSNICCRHKQSRNANVTAKHPVSPPSVRGAWSEILREWRTHWFECVPNADWPWQGCYNSRRGLYNHLITKAVSQRGSLLAPSMAASGVPLAASLSDWSMLMALQK